MADTRKKIWVVRNLQGGHEGHVIADTLEEASAKASRLYARPVDQLVVIDTGKRQPKCCGKQ